MPGTSVLCPVAGTPCPGVAGPTVPSATTGVVMPTVPGAVATSGTATGGIPMPAVPSAPSASSVAVTPAAPSTATLAPTTATVVPSRPATVGSDGIVLVPLAIGAVGLVLLVALVAAAVAGRRGRGTERPRTPEPRRDNHFGAPATWQPGPAGDGTEGGDGTLPGAFAPSDADVAELIHAFDLAGTEAERAAVERQLAAIGVLRLAVTPGDPVDSSRHHVVGVAPHGSGGPAGTVSEVVRPGWADGQRVIRVSDVRAHATTRVHP
ncbi:hypothetical protein ACFQU3_11355 [Terrabacter sp. GCM10028922]|uniref:hypothetical protein n=1 Tax=Terrabacter sp. GCM10028922 TaxID=3273428 RepID=UPI00361C2020